MELLIDTNIIIDFLTQRQPFCVNSTRIIKSCIDEEFTGIIAAHSIINIFYIARKDFSQNDLRRVLVDLTKVFKIAGVDESHIISALKNSDFADFEDCVQSECAAQFHVDYIITRNTKDFALSKIPALTPEEFFEKIEPASC